MLCAAATRDAAAHPTQMSRITLTLHGATIDAELQVSAYDLGEALAVRDLADAQGRAVADVAATRRAALEAYLLRVLTVTAARGTGCAGALQEVTARAQFLHARLRWRCASPAGDLAFESRLFHAIDGAARLMVLLNHDAVQRQTLLDATNSRWVLREAPTTRDVLGRYLCAGAEHIFIGHDHVAFLIGVILWGRRAWPLVKAVTAFTVAHSVTLALAVFDVLRIPGALVEAAIALSIVYIAVENYFVRQLDTRWRITAVLGLVHGLGFASVLRDYGLPSQALGWALGAFNLGVEIGQLAIVLAATGVLLALDRMLAGPRDVPVRSPVVVGFGSAVVGALGAYWFVERAGWAA